MNIDGNLNAINKHIDECDKREKEIEHAENELFKRIEPYIDGLNNSMRIQVMFSIMGKQQCREYIIDTIKNLLDV